MFRWVIFIALLPYSTWLIFFYEYHFIDHVNLAFHEAGHLIFTPFGKTGHFLGGTIGQLFFPVAIAVHFWRQGKAFEADVGGVWFAESLMYAAHYMSDARDMRMPLVGGGVHDWNFLFTKWGVLYRAEAIGTFFHVLAAVLLMGALLFMFRQLKTGKSDATEPLL